MIIECQKHKDYQESIHWLLGFLEEYASHSKTVAGAGAEPSLSRPLTPLMFLPSARAPAQDSHEQATADPALQQATHELRTLLERFANGTSLSVIGDAIQALYNDAQGDEELKDWFKSVDTYTRKVSFLLVRFPRTFFLHARTISILPYIFLSSLAYFPDDRTDGLTTMLRYS